MGTGASVVAAETAVDEGAEYLELSLTAPIKLRTLASNLSEWIPLENLPEATQIKFDGGVKGNEATDIDSWNFNIWACNDDDLMALAALIYTRLNMPKTMGIDAKVAGKFFRAIEALMNRNNNDYHSFHHVVDVMHSSYLFLRTFKAETLLNDVEQFALVTGAICHDLDHPGTNNTYHVNKHTRLAIVYNDNSILENYHCARTFELLSQADYDVLNCLDNAQRKEVRRIMIMCIMATDMVLHFGMKANLDKLATKLTETPLAPMTLPDPKERDLVLQVILHAADVSNPGKQWQVCKDWSDHVIAEFFSQGDMEKEEGLPVSMNCDRDTTFQDELSMNFSDFIVGPFYISIANLLPHAVGSVKNLKSNRDGWFDMYKARVDADNAEGALKEKVAGWVGRAANTTAQFDAAIAAAESRL